MTAGTVLITGAAKRIGAVLARGLAAQGWAVAIHYHRSGEAAQDLSREIEAIGGRAATLCADLADEGQAEELPARAAAVLGTVRALVNNASVFEPDEIDTVTRESWDRHQKINLRAPFVLTRAFAHSLPPDETGAVVNMIDHRVWKLNPQCFSYTLSKAGLWTLTRSLAQGLAPRIRVNAIGPGPVFPNVHQEPHLFEREAAALPLGHGPAPDEIFEAVRFLLDSPSITGQMIAVDGGQHLAWDTPDLRAGRGE